MKKLTLLALIALFGSQTNAMRANPAYGTSLVQKAMEFDGEVVVCELEDSEIKSLEEVVAEENKTLQNEQLKIKKQYLFDYEQTCFSIEKVKKEKKAKKRLLL